MSPEASDFLLVALVAAAFLPILLPALTPLARHRRYRRLKGGHWELRMYGDMGQYEVWERWPHCAAAERLPWQKGRATCEDHPTKER